jgi:hypothetical protein
MDEKVCCYLWGMVIGMAYVLVFASKGGAGGGSVGG